MIEYTSSPQEESYHEEEALKNLKKDEKTFAKGIDKAERKWYNTKVAAKVVTGNDP